MLPSGAKKMMLVSGRAFPSLADEVAACLGIKPTPTKLFDFANGEIFVRFLDSVRGCDVFVLQSHTSPINEWIMEQLIMVDALFMASTMISCSMIHSLMGEVWLCSTNTSQPRTESRKRTKISPLAKSKSLVGVGLMPRHAATSSASEGKARPETIIIFFAPDGSISFT